MYRIVFAVVVAALMLSRTESMVRHADAASKTLPPSLVLQIEESGITAEQTSAISARLNGVLTTLRGKHKEWGCIGDLREFLIEPLQLPVRLTVTVTRPSLAGVYSGSYTVGVTLRVLQNDKTAGGPDQGTVEAEESVNLQATPGDVERIAARAADLFAILAEQLTGPCRMKAQLKLGGVTLLNGNVTHYSYEGVADLTLSETSSFSAPLVYSSGETSDRALDDTRGFSITAPMVATMTMDPVEGCTRQFTLVNPRMRLQTGFRENDGALLVEQLTVEQDAILSSDACSWRSEPCVWEEREALTRVSGPCPVVGSGITSFSLFGGRQARLGGDMDLAVPLGSTASLALPQPQTVNPNLTQWSATLVLTAQDEAVAQAP